jgi:hypothetical protein
VAGSASVMMIAPGVSTKFDIAFAIGHVLIKAQKVGCWWLSRNLLLNQSIAGFDPQLTSGRRCNPPAASAVFA